MQDQSSPQLYSWSSPAILLTVRRYSLHPTVCKGLCSWGQNYSKICSAGGRGSGRLRSYRQSMVPITTHSASNMVAALKKCDVVQSACFGHVLHNAVGSGVKEQRITRAVEVCRKIMPAFSFKKSSLHSSASRAAASGKKNLSLMLQVATRWGSKYNHFLITILSRLVSE